MFVDADQQVVQREAWAKLQAAADEPLARRHEAETAWSIAADAVSKVQRRLETESSARVEADARTAEETERRKEAVAAAAQAQQDVRQAQKSQKKAEQAAKLARLELGAIKARSVATAMAEARDEVVPQIAARLTKSISAGFEKALTRLSRLKNAALARARNAEARAATSEGRLARAQQAEQEAQALSAENEELHHELSELRKANATLTARQAPDLAGGRDKGRFTALPWQMRVLVWGQLARRTPPSAVGPNVVDAARVLAPGCRCVSRTSNRFARCESRWRSLVRPWPPINSQAASGSSAPASTRRRSCRRGC